MTSHGVIWEVWPGTWICLSSCSTREAYLNHFHGLMGAQSYPLSRIVIIWCWYSSVEIPELSSQQIRLPNRQSKIFVIIIITTFRYLPNLAITTWCTYARWRPKGHLFVQYASQLASGEYIILAAVAFVQKLLLERVPVLDQWKPAFYFCCWRMPITALLKAHTISLSQVLQKDNETDDEAHQAHLIAKHWDKFTS